MRIRRLFPLLLPIAFAACTRSFPVYDVASLKPQTTPRDYLYYSLPRTVMTVDVPITKTDVEIDGPCIDAAFDQFRAELLLAKPKKAGASFKEGKPVIGTRAEPDPDAVYAVDLRFQPFALTSATFEMTESGVLTTAAVSQEDQSLDAVLSVARIALAATGATSAAAASAPAVTTAVDAEKETVCKQTFAAIREVRSQRLQILKDSFRQEAASETYLNAVLAKLDELEQGLAAAFVGTSTKTVGTIHCEWRPSAFDAAGSNGLTLFQFSRAAGPIATPNAPCVVPRSIAGAPHADTIYVTANVRRDGDGSQFADKVKAVQRSVDEKARGFFYRVPASAIVSVDFNADPRTREVKQLAQLGTVATLPTLGGAFVRKAGMTPTLNAAGGLQKLVLNGESGGNAAITGAGELLASIRAAEEAEAAAKAAASDELAMLERQRKIIEEKKKIAEAEQRLAELRGQQ